MMQTRKGNDMGRVPKTTKTREILQYFVGLARGRSTRSHLNAIIRDIFGVKNFTKELTRLRPPVHSQDLSYILRGIPIDTLYQIFVAEGTMSENMSLVFNLRIELCERKKQMDKMRRKGKDIPKRARTNYRIMRKLYDQGCAGFANRLGIHVSNGSAFLTDKDYTERFEQLKQFYKRSKDDYDSYDEFDGLDDLLGGDYSYDDYDDEDIYPQPPRVQRRSPQPRRITRNRNYNRGDAYSNLDYLLEGYDDDEEDDDDNYAEDSSSDLGEKLDTLIQLTMASLNAQKTGRVADNYQQYPQPPKRTKNVSQNTAEVTAQNDINVRMIEALNKINQRLDDQQDTMDTILTNLPIDEEEYEETYGPVRNDPEAEEIKRLMYGEVIEDDEPVQQPTPPQSSQPQVVILDEDYDDDKDITAYTNEDLVNAVNREKGKQIPQQKRKIKTVTT